MKRRKIGGPAKRAPKEGERVALSLRMTPDLKRRLDEAAEAGGRSQSQEAEVRLERSFDRTDLLSEVMSLEFGDRLAGLLIMLGHAMKSAAHFTGLMLLERNKLRQVPRSPWLDDWADDPTEYESAVVAANLLLEGARPEEAFEDADLAAANAFNSAKSLVRDMLDADEPEIENVLNSIQLRKMLGATANRVWKNSKKWPDRRKEAEP
jgi:hypothetical protein